MTVVLLGLSSVFTLLGSFVLLVSAIAMFRGRDAYARINVLSSATGLGLPCIVIGVYLHGLQTTGFELVMLFKMLVTVAGFAVVGSIGGNTLGRAAYLSGAVPHPDTTPQEIADPHR